MEIQKIDLVENPDEIKDVLVGSSESEAAYGMPEVSCTGGVAGCKESCVTGCKDSSKTGVVCNGGCKPSCQTSCLDSCKNSPKNGR